MPIRRLQYFQHFDLQTHLLQSPEHLQAHASIQIIAIVSCAQRREYVHEERALYLLHTFLWISPNCAHKPARLCKYISTCINVWYGLLVVQFSHCSCASLRDSIRTLRARRRLCHELCWRLAVLGITLRSTLGASSLQRRMGLVIGVGTLSRS